MIPYFNGEIHYPRQFQSYKSNLSQFQVNYKFFFEDYKHKK